MYTAKVPEVARYRICPRDGQYGIQIPPMAWHTIEVHEPGTIFEAKDGAYGKCENALMRECGNA